MKKVLHWLDENLEELPVVVFLIAMTLTWAFRRTFPLRTWAIPFLVRGRSPAICSSGAVF